MRVWTVVLLLAPQEVGPALVSASARQDPTRVTLIFSRPVDQTSAEAVGNYSIDNGVKIESAVRSTLDLRTVTLTVSPLSEGVTYTLTARNLHDCSNPPLALGETKRPFIFVRGLFGTAPKEEGSSGRLALPKFKEPVLFNGPEADAILAALQVFPRNNPWNEDVSKRPVHPDSDRMIAAIGKDGTLDFNWDMNFVVVPPTQPRVEVRMIGFAGESDKGPFPVPSNTPIEGWPVSGGALEASQTSGRGDRHAIVVDPSHGMLYEFYQMVKRPGGWEAAGEATFDLKTNKLRPRGWTSADAAGLPIFPSLPRFDECERGIVDHALRVTVDRTRRAFIYPATHQAGSTDLATVPAMGQRLRLKAGVDLAGLPRHALAIAQALKKHGMLVADNGTDWRISVPPDRRLHGLESLRKFKGSDFEVIVTTGENELGRP